MEPLKKLFDLYEAEFPQLQDSATAVEGPNKGEYRHPVIQNKKEIDNRRAQGATPQDAHQLVNGEVDTGDAQSKADLASTMGRTQDETTKGGVQVDHSMDELSIFGKDAEIEAAVKQTTPQDVKTPSDQHVPDSEQPVETQEEYDYNDDVAYLRTYGRA